MFSRSARSVQTSIARIILATLLMLVVFASATPFNLLASSAKCRMSCCVARRSHRADSHRADSSCHAMQDGKNQTKTTDAQDNNSSSPQTAFSQLMMAQCSRECGCCAASVSMQLRRPRETAALLSRNQLRPATLFQFRGNSSLVPPLSAGRNRQLQPRAPPRFLINLSA